MQSSGYKGLLTLSGKQFGRLYQSFEKLISLDLLIPLSGIHSKEASRGADKDLRTKMLHLVSFSGGLRMEHLTIASF